jgi:hypothetical protein
MMDKGYFVRDVFTPDGAGGNVITQQVVWEPIYVSVREITPSDEFIATQRNIRMLVEIECRYNPEKPILAGDKFIWRGFTFMTLLPTTNRVGRMTKIRAYAEIETSAR